ncbi:queuosine precursor transporter [Paracoccus sp. M683]|uniref:queuosine precursor transporter n=1 Tax=Paracoccus sp. M683 TaxID=2594268 RepID=UPI001180663F|nr:queuosine precursor transporter [Paracoccus sp. M683]TRW98592.1 queuosine precursor transporter [Paracoccus sp. M683]
MTRHLPGIIAMAAIVVASNILVQYQLGNWLTYGALSYPIAFLVTDVMNRVYGAAAARRVVLAGFVVGVICSLIAAGLDATTLRIAIASGTAFLVAQLLDVAVFDRLRQGRWWRAPLASTLVGSFVDTALFFSIAFSASLSFIDPADDVSWANELLPLVGTGPEAPLWASLAFADWLCKLALALLALVPFRLIVNNLLSKTQEI